MYLTRSEIAQLPTEAFTSIQNLRIAISAHYGCSVSDSTARRILADFSTEKTTSKNS